MNQGTQGYSLTKKTEGRKSRDTVSLSVKSQKVTTQHITVGSGSETLKFLIKTAKDVL
jgi:hypothetical protein